MIGLVRALPGRRAGAVLLLLAAAPGGERDGLPWELLPGTPPERRAAAFAAVERDGADRDLAPLVDLLRFAETPEEWYAILDAASAVTGEDERARERPWRNLTLLLAAREPALFDDYRAWKAELLARAVDPRYRELVGGDSPARVRLDEVVWGGVGPDGIPPLDDPAVLPAGAATYLDPDDPVFGVALGGAARAYPLRILDWHEMANDVVGGVPVTLAYCTLCGAGVLYRAALDGERVTFSTSGLLYRSNKLMVDRGTRTLWNQLTGRPVLGTLAGDEVELEVLPVVLTTWREWRARHPATTALAPDTGFERDYAVGAAYGEYFASPETMFPAHVERSEEGALDVKEQVFVVRVGGARRGYRLRDLGRAEGLLNDRVGERHVVVVGRSGSAASTATAGRSGRRGPSAEDGPAAATRALAHPVRAYASLSGPFERAPDGRGLVDARGRLHALDEDALIGPDGGRSPRLPGHLVFGFAWDAFFADAVLAGAPDGR